MDTDWQTDLERWLAPYLKVLGNKTRRRMCPAYIAGLIGPGDRKSIQSMATRANAISYDRLHHFIAAGLSDSAPLEATLWQQADDLVGGDKAWLIIDDTALPKKGKASVGVAPQYATALGKNANCQTLVSATLASGEVPVMLGFRLFLPESWTSDTARMSKSGVPEPFQVYRTKPEIAIEEIDRVIAAGVRFGCVLADAGYGLSASFRQALSARDLCWAVGIPRHQKVYPADVQLTFPVAGRGRPRLRPVPDVRSRAAHAMLEDAKWRQISWRRGTKGRLVARFAAMRVRIADGAPQRIGSAGAQHMPGEEAWLVGEHRSNGERKYYLSNLPADTPIKNLAGAIKARWICEQAHQQLKEELGLDHFEGRSWAGLHRHALMTIMAYAFLQTRRLALARRKKKYLRSTASAKPAGGPPSHY
ncbi:IS701 family transposase [Mesorhizobium sp. M0976]|uniref:IS701 family transposase n=1 Tax=Mesorhizobium sp. M0976 TaxID=2957038 RepID=UPI00333E0915